MCLKEKERIEGTWKDLDNDVKKNERLIYLHTVYSTIIDAIDAPQTKKENFEAYVSELLDRELKSFI